MASNGSEMLLDAPKMILDACQMPPTFLQSRVAQPGLHRQDYTVKISQPGVHNQDYTAKIAQPGLHNQDYTTRISQPGLRSKLPLFGVARWSHFLCFAVLALPCFLCFACFLFRVLASEPILVWTARLAWAWPWTGPRDPGLGPLPVFKNTFCGR